MDSGEKRGWREATDWIGHILHIQQPACLLVTQYLLLSEDSNLLTSFKAKFETVFRLDYFPTMYFSYRI